LEIILPFLKKILDIWIDDTEGIIVTKILEVIMESFIASRNNFPSNLLINIIDMVLEVYNINPQPLAIKLISLAIEHVVLSNDIYLYLSTVLHKLSIKTFEILAKDMNKIEIITEYFNLLDLCILKSPNIIIVEQNPTFIPNNALELGIVSLTFAELDPVLAVLKFLEDFNFGPHSQSNEWQTYINSAFEQIGVKLIHNLFIAIIKDIPRLVDREAILLFKLVRRYENVIRGILKIAFPINCVQNEFDVDKFIDILMSVDQKRFKVFIKDFIDITSGLSSFEQLLDYLF